MDKGKGGVLADENSRWFVAGLVKEAFEDRAGYL